MNKILTLTLLLAFSIGLAAQPKLLPPIGASAEPSDDTPICPIPLSTSGDFEGAGLPVGATIPDFTLYAPNGEQLHIRDVLAKGKPVLLVGGNYTCPIFRNKTAIINWLVSVFGDALSVFVIYGVEAHPAVDISPYFGEVNTVKVNEVSGIVCRQPETYGQRKALAQRMLGKMRLDAPLYLDGPCNEWWLTFGPAPNNAYLINAKGVVVAKQGWFHKPPY